MSPPVVFCSSEASTVPGADQVEVEQASCDSSAARKPGRLGSTRRRERTKPPAKLTNNVSQLPNFAGLFQVSSLRISSTPDPLSWLAAATTETSSPSIRPKVPKGSVRTIGEQNTLWLNIR